MTPISVYLRAEARDRALPASYYHPPNLAAGRQIETWETDPDLTELLDNIDVEED